MLSHLESCWRHVPSPASTSGRGRLCSRESTTSLTSNCSDRSWKTLLAPDLARRLSRPGELVPPFLLARDAWISWQLPCWIHTSARAQPEGSLLSFPFHHVYWRVQLLAEIFVGNRLSTGSSLVDYLLIYEVLWTIKNWKLKSYYLGFLPTYQQFAVSNISALLYKHFVELNPHSTSADLKTYIMIIGCGIVNVRWYDRDSWG